MLLEGDKLISEALAERMSLEAVWFTGEFSVTGGALVKSLTEAGCRVSRVSERLMRKISTLETPPGVVAVGCEPRFEFRKPGDRFSLIVALAQVQDPGNLGGVIRTADYFGVDEIWVGPGSADPYNPKTLRGAMGASFRMPVVRVKNFNARVKGFVECGAEAWAAVAHDDKAAAEIGAAGARILIIGGESGGLNVDDFDFPFKTVKIAGARRSESLNLAVAAGILIHSATVDRVTVTGCK